MKKTSPALKAGLVFLYSFFMRKIKKFKIPIYSYEIMRKAKKAGAQLENAGLSGERDFKEYVSQLASAIEPAVVFDYFPPGDPDTSVLGSAQKNPLTIAMLTLGNAIYEKDINETDETRKIINAAAVPVFAAAAAKVIADLASQEASPEGFELGEPFYIYSSPEQAVLPKQKKQEEDELPLFAAEPEEENTLSATQELPLYRDELIKTLFARLEAAKIGMMLENGKLTPQYSSVFALEWILRKNKHK